jgi:hypothetical protein
MSAVTTRMEVRFGVPNPHPRISLHVRRMNNLPSRGLRPARRQLLPLPGRRWRPRRGRSCSTTGSSESTPSCASRSAPAPRSRHPDARGTPHCAGQARHATPRRPLVTRTTPPHCAASAGWVRTRRPQRCPTRHRRPASSGGRSSGTGQSWPTPFIGATTCSARRTRDAGRWLGSAPPRGWLEAACGAGGAATRQKRAGQGLRAALLRTSATETVLGAPEGRQEKGQRPAGRHAGLHAQR